MCAMMSVLCSYHGATHESWFSPPTRETGTEFKSSDLAANTSNPLNHLAGTTSSFSYSNQRFSRTVYPVCCLVFQLPPLIESHCVAQVGLELPV